MISQATPTDFEFFYGLYMHPQVNPYLLYEFMDAAAFRPIYDELQQQGKLYLFHHEGTPVGMFKLVPNQHRASHIVYLGGLAIDPAQSGKGHGLAMLQAIVELCRKLGFLRVELSVATVNASAIRLYERAGFVQEGVLRQYTHLKSEGRFLDEIMMAYLMNNQF